MILRAMGVGFLLFIVLVLVIEAHHGEFPVLEGPYLGQKAPGTTPEVFAPGIVSTDAPEGCICFSYDGKYVVFRRHFREQTEIFISENDNGTWTKPRRAPFFVKGYGFGDFTFAPNELKVYFTSNRPLDASKEPAGSGNLWVVENTNNKWLKPVPLGTTVNSPQHESYPSVSKDKTLYFFRRYESEDGASDILTSVFENGTYSAPRRLGNTINTQWHEWDPCISPDGKILVFCSRKPGGLGEDDLYVSFKSDDGRWPEAISLGSTVNSTDSENRPFITADGKYLFYTSTAGGNRDVYWVDMELVRRLKPTQ